MSDHLVDGISCSFGVFCLFLTQALHIGYVLHLFLALVCLSCLLFIASFGLGGQNLGVLCQLRCVSVQVLKVFAEGLILLKSLFVHDTLLSGGHILCNGRVRILFKFHSFYELSVVHDAHEGRH